MNISLASPATRNIPVRIRSTITLVETRSRTLCFHGGLITIAETRTQRLWKGKKYVQVTPVKVGISGENYYEVQSGVEEEDMIVIGGYKALSKILNHGDLVKIKN